MSKRNPTDPTHGYYSRHHRRPVSKGGAEVTKGGRQNVVVVPDYKHVAFHRLFNNMNPDQIAKELSYILSTLNATWIDPDWMIIAVRRKP